MCAPSRDQANYRSQPHLRPAETSESGGVVVEPFPVTFEGFTYQGHIAFDPSAGKRPVVLVFPNCEAHRPLTPPQH